MVTILTPETGLAPLSLLGALAGYPARSVVLVAGRVVAVVGTVVVAAVVGVDPPGVVAGEWPVVGDVDTVVGVVFDEPAAVVEDVGTVVLVVLVVVVPSPSG